MTWMCLWGCSCLAVVITHWDRGNMATVSQKTFSNTFSSTKMFAFHLNFTEVHSYKSSKIPALFQIMAWCHPGDKPLSETMMVRLRMYICVTQPQWVSGDSLEYMSLTILSLLFTSAGIIHVSSQCRWGDCTFYGKVNGMQLIEISVFLHSHMLWLISLIFYFFIQIWVSQLISA